MIKNRFSLKQLEALVFVVDTGTFRRAAAALGTTQPNISARIAALEETLGQVLLFRDAGSVRVSAHGQKIVAQARRVLRESERLLEVSDRKDLVEEKLRLGVTELIACTSLRGLLRQVAQEYPNLKVHLDVNLASDILEKFKAHELDLVLVSGPVPPGGRHFTPIFESPYVWVAAPTIAAQFGDAPTLGDILAVSTLTHARNTTAVDALKAQCRAMALPFDNVVHSSSLAACVPMAMEGMGVALLPYDLVQEPVAEGRLALVHCAWVPPPLQFYAGFNSAHASLYVARAAALAQQTLGA